jgi:hypothetical protein
MPSKHWPKHWPIRRVAALVGAALTILAIAALGATPGLATVLSPDKVIWS